MSFSWKSFEKQISEHKRILNLPSILKKFHLSIDRVWRKDRINFEIENYNIGIKNCIQDNILSHVVQESNFPLGRKFADLRKFLRAATTLLNSFWKYLSGVQFRRNQNNT